MAPTATQMAMLQNGDHRFRILIVGNVIHAHDEVKQLKLTYDIEQMSCSSREEFFANCTSRYQGVIAIYRHNDSANSIGFFDSELIRRLPSSVRFICHNGAGYDQIDIGECSRRGIQVSHTPGSIADATATTAMWLIITALRRYLLAEANVRHGLFKQGLSPASDPENKVLGIIGMGGIGLALAKRAIGFNMKVQYHNRKPSKDNLPHNINYISNLDELLATSDVISLNLPLNSRTSGMIDAEAISKMKPGVILINTARGGVVDQEAMIQALESGHINAVGLDVYPEEPHIDQRLIQLANSYNGSVVLLPHMGTETKETQRKMEIQVFDNIVSALQGRGLINQVIEQKQ